MEIETAVNLYSYEQLRNFLYDYDKDNHTHYLESFEHGTTWRLVESKTNKTYVKDKQLKTMKILLLYIILSKLNPDQFERSYILFAEFQSGKSGIFSNLIFVIFNNDWIRTLLQLEYALVLTPISDCDLIKQIKGDVNDRNHGIEYFTKFPQRLKVMMNSNGKENGFNSKGLKSHIDLGHFQKNTIVIIDEIHHGQDKTMATEKILNYLGISNGVDKNTLHKKNFFCVGVSATPHSEIASTKEFKHKQIIYHDPGDMYFGLKRMYEKDRFKPFWELDDAGIEKLSQLLIEQIRKEKTENKYSYIIIRARNVGRNKNDMRRYDKVVRELKKLEESEDLLCSVEEINQGSEDGILSINDLIPSEDETTKLKKTKIYIIKNILTAGVRIENKHLISIMFDYKSNQRSYNETITQGLVGRACCYIDDNDKDPHEIVIYTDVGHVKDYIDMIDTGFDFLPEKAKNTKISKKKNSNKWILYKESNPELWPKNRDECNALIHKTGEIGKYLLEKDLVESDEDYPIGEFKGEASKYIENGIVKEYSIHKEATKKRE